MDTEDPGYRALFEGAADGVFVADDDGVYVDANPAAARMFGVERGALIGSRITDFVIQDGDGDGFQQHWSTFIGSDVEGGRVRILRGDGRVLVCDYNSTANFVPGRHLSILRDVTEMIEAQHDREQSEHRFRRMLDALDIFAVVTDLEGRATFVNRAMLSRLGLELDQVIGRQLMLSQPDGDAQHAAFLSAIANEEIAPEWENEILIADRTHRIRWSSAFVRDESDRIEAVASIGEDVTIRRQLEEQVRHAVRVESLGRLAAGVAHDFNNILNVIGGHAELLADAAELTAKSRSHINQITSGVDRATLVTRQLLAYGRQQIMESCDVSVGDAIGHLVSMLAPMLGPAVAIEVIQRADDDVVFIDPAQLDQVLVNLAVNARDAMPNGGTLRLEVAASEIDKAYGAQLGIVAGHYVTVTVADTGSGIPPELLGHIFEPFVTTKPVGAGTGLGLSTAYGIITQSKGAITVASRQGIGTTFTIHLPSRPPASDAPLPRSQAGVATAE